MSTFFQTTSGGRQQRDLSLTYPALQKSLDDINISLLLVTDGRGVKEASDRVLNILFEGVAACLSLEEIETEMLSRTIENLIKNSDSRFAKTPIAALHRIIESTLNQNLEVTVEKLPVERGYGQIALASYVQEFPSLSLELLNFRNYLALAERRTHCTYAKNC